MMVTGRREKAPLVVLAGGKSGGHVYPAFAVGEELQSRGWRLLMVGSPTGMEGPLAERRGLEFVTLPSRAWVGRGLVSRLTALAVLAVSSLRAAVMLRRRQASAVLGTGGFVSVPTVLGAVLARVPIVLLEPNARAGSANRALSRFASGAVVSYQSAAGDLRCGTRLTGAPVRAEFLAITPEEPQATDDAAETVVGVLVLGGSQGAKRLNQVLPAALQEAAASRPLSVVHQTGAGNLDEAAELYGQTLGAASVAGPAGTSGAPSTSGAGRRFRTPRLDVELVSFIDDMATCMSAAAVIISRAGAVTLAEICAAGRASILVPLGLAGAHQVENARELSSAGAAQLVEESQLDELARLLSELVVDDEARRTMAKRARALARPDAAAQTADFLTELAGQGVAA